MPPRLKENAVDLALNGPHISPRFQYHALATVDHNTGPIQANPSDKVSRHDLHGSSRPLCIFHLHQPPPFMSGRHFLRGSPDAATGKLQSMIVTFLSRWSVFALLRLQRAPNGELAGIRGKPDA